MNYNKIYNNLISRAKNRKLNGYVERHHIIPVSEGGSNDPDNLVELTAREHFFAHLLLYKQEKTSSRVNALWAMIRESDGQSRYYPSSRIYGYLKEERAIHMRESQVDRKHIYNPKTNEKRFVKGDMLTLLLSKGWKYGTPNQSPTKGKIGIHKPNTRIKKYINHSELDEYIKKGWVKGLYKFKSSHSWGGSRKGKGNPNYGKRAIHNPTTGDRVYVSPDKLNEYLDNGYKLGRGPNNL